MTTNAPTQQESVGEQPTRTVHLVCRDCPHEDLHDSISAAQHDAETHLDDEPEHKVRYEEVDR